MQVDDFISRVILSSITICYKKIGRRVGLASGIVRNLDKWWQSKDIRGEVKMRLYHALVQSILPCNTETWTLKEDNNRKLRVFRCLLRRSWSIKKGQEAQCRYNERVEQRAQSTRRRQPSSAFFTKLSGGRCSVISYRSPRSGSGSNAFFFTYPSTRRFSHCISGLNE